MFELHCSEFELFCSESAGQPRGIVFNHVSRPAPVDNIGPLELSRFRLRLIVQFDLLCLIPPP